MPVSIKFLGGVRTVSGSSHLLAADKCKVLLDAGLFHGRRRDFYSVNSTFNFNPRSIDALILSHAHIDHCGNIPALARNGLRCKIFATGATRDLCRLMLEDSGKIQEEDINYINKINRRMHLPPQRPLYTERDARRAIKNIRPLSYGQKFSAAGNINAAFYDAGHILGSGTVVLDIAEGRRVLRLGYAVDLGRKGLPLLNDPVVPKGLDYLIIESTYGGRLHAPIEEAKGRLKEAINRTVERKGKIIIPSFALERTQEILYFLNELLKEGSIPSLPIYVDSPLATDITEVFKCHLAYFNPQAQQVVSRGRGPFDFLNLSFIRQQRDSKALNHDRRPMIILAGSGMCEAGRVLHHLKNNIEDSRNTVLVVGYMAGDTLGKKIVEKKRYVPIFGMDYELNAEVVVINSFSGHADKNGLREFIRACQPLKKVFLVHGDLDQSQALADALEQEGISVHLPEKNEEAALV